MTNTPKLFPRFAFWFCVLCYAGLVAIGFDDIEEDAFIYFRFAHNIAGGFGYVFNIGGEHIEACSGLLWLGMLTLLTFLPIHIVLATKLLCFLLGVLCIRSVFVLSQRFIADRFLSLLPAFLMVVSIPFYTWSVRGLETALYWFAMVWLVDWATDTSRRAWWWLPALVVLNSRPEGFLMLLAVVPYLFFCEQKAARFWQGAAIVGAGFAAVTLWRFWYFHDIVPHPFYFKVNPDHLQSLKNLFTYGWHAGWWLLMLLALPGITRSWRARDVALLGALVLSLLWPLYVFEDKVYNRHTGMALPFVYITALMLLSRWLPAGRWLQAVVRMILVLLTLHTLLFSRYVHFRDSHPSPFLMYVMRAADSSQHYWQDMGSLLENPDDFREQPDDLGIFNIRYNLIASVGDFVRLNYSDDAVVVYDQIGQAPWYAGSHTFFIDNLGLGYRDIGIARFHRMAQQSRVYGLYETLLTKAVQLFWPDERRDYSDDEILQRVVEHDPAVIIARKPYLRQQGNLLKAWLQHPLLAGRYEPRYLLNNREIIFERSERRVEFLRIPDNAAVSVPPGASVKGVLGWSWCEEEGLCLTLEP